MTVFDRLTRVIAPAFVVLASAHIASAQTTAPASGEDPVVAVVDGKEIHLSEVAETQRNLPDQYQMLPLDAIFATLVERLIDLQLVVVEGRKANLQDDEVVKRRMTQIEDRVIRDIYVSRHVDEVMTEEVLLARYDEFKRRTRPRKRSGRVTFSSPRRRRPRPRLPRSRAAPTSPMWPRRGRPGRRAIGVGISAISPATPWCPSSPMPRSPFSPARSPRPRSRRASVGM